MPISEARIPTPWASRYLSQLCQHFVYRRPVDQKGDHAWIALDTGVCTLDAHPGLLILSIEASSPARLVKAQEAITESLRRFIYRERPVIEWGPRRAE